MKFAALKKGIRYTSFFVPVNFLLVLLIAAMLFTVRLVQNAKTDPESSYDAIIALFIKTVLIFSSAVAALGLLTTLIPWILFLINKKNNRISAEIKTDVKQSVHKNKQSVFIHIKPILKPLFGFIKLRLKYDDGKISRKFTLLKTEPKMLLLNPEVKGYYNWDVPDIKEYHVDETVIYFEDMFQLFSFAAVIPAKDHFYTAPADAEVAEVRVQPKKTEDTQVRIEKIRKVEGELLNYKNFENNDDVRRIVWKIYAKNGELVVRIPETNDPYASHVYFYTSFFNDVSDDLYEELNSFLLNHYKTLTWNIYQQVSKQAVLLKYIPDQPAPAGYADDPLQKVKYTFSTADWQNNNPLPSYVKDDASVLCISSFTNAQQLEDILEKTSKDILIVFVQLSNAFRATTITDWLHRLYIKPGDRSYEQMRMMWDLSPLKRTVTANEERLFNILNRSEAEKPVIL